MASYGLAVVSMDVPPPQSGDVTMASVKPVMELLNQDLPPSVRLSGMRHWPCCNACRAESVPGLVGAVR